MSRHASPAGQLLRNSRLFSLPQALPKPIIEQYVLDGKIRSSDTATTAYPLRQAITTPSSSAHRGDWGLKRSLPKKAANRSSEPVHTVLANDTYEGITDYHSASPHVKTLQRFQELNVALSRQDQKVGTRDHTMMAMDPAFDYTDERVAGSRRWKHEGGNVRSMTPADFDKYLEKTVAARKDEFMAHLRARAHVMFMEEQRDSEAVALAAGTADDDSLLVAMRHFTSWLLMMRDARGAVLDEYLAQRTADAAVSYAANVRYLLRTQWRVKDIRHDASPEAQQLKDKIKNATQSPPASPVRILEPSVGDRTAAAWLTFLTHIEKLEQDFLLAWQDNSWDSDGSIFRTRLQAWRKDTTLLSPINTIVRQFLDLPPLTSSTPRSSDMPGALRGSEAQTSFSTHPSAGLSYLRTNKLLPNHPILGPQKTDAPIKARFIGKVGAEKRAVYGVAGFVASSEQGNRELDLTTPGGAKGERKIKNVWVNGEGRIQISLEASRDTDALGVRDGRLERPNGQENLTRENLMGTLRSGGQQSQQAGVKTAPRAKPLEDETVSVFKNLYKEMENKARPQQ